MDAAATAALVTTQLEALAAEQTLRLESDEHMLGPMVKHTALMQRSEKAAAEDAMHLRDDDIAFRTSCFVVC